MVSLLRFLLILIEWGVQLRRKDVYKKKQERLRQARTDPVNYLRKFGRVQRDQPSNSEDSVPRSGASADQHDSQ